MQNSPQGQDIFVVGAQSTPWNYSSDSPFLFSPSSSQLSFHRSPLTQMPGLYPSASYPTQLRRWEQERSTHRSQPGRAGLCGIPVRGWCRDATTETPLPSFCSRGKRTKIKTQGFHTFFWWWESIGEGLRESKVSNRAISEGLRYSNNAPIFWTFSVPLWRSVGSSFSW